METEKPDGFPGLPEEFVRQNAKYMRLLPVSYTHLTLPTNSRV
mgnify:CR=1 FL=1